MKRNTNYTVTLKSNGTLTFHYHGKRAGRDIDENDPRVSSIVSHLEAIAGIVAVDETNITKIKMQIKQ